MHDDFDQPPKPVDRETLERGHEFRDIGIRGIVWFLVIFLICAAVISAIVWAMFRQVARSEARTDEEPTPLARERQEPPEPRLQPSPGRERQPWEDLAEMREGERRILESFGEGRIPIEKAMELVVRRGGATTRSSP